MSRIDAQLKDIGRIQELMGYWGVEEFTAMLSQAVVRAASEMDPISRELLDDFGKFRAKIDEVRAELGFHA